VDVKVGVEVAGIEVLVGVIVEIMAGSGGISVGIGSLAQLVKIIRIANIKLQYFAISPPDQSNYIPEKNWVTCNKIMNGTGFEL